MQASSMSARAFRPRMSRTLKCAFREKYGIFRLLSSKMEFFFNGPQIRYFFLVYVFLNTKFREFFCFFEGRCGFFLCGM